MLIDRKWEPIYEFLLDKLKEKYIVMNILQSVWLEEFKINNSANLDEIFDIRVYEDERYDLVRNNIIRTIDGVYTRTIIILEQQQGVNRGILHINRLFNNNTIVFDVLDPINFYIRTCIYHEDNDVFLI